MAKSYTGLQADVAAWARRSDLTTMIPSFIEMGEDEIYKTSNFALRVREMETEADLTVTDLVATIPADFLEARYIKLDNSTRDTIFYISPEKWKPSSTGYFTIVGTEVRLPTGVNSNLKLVYYSRPARLVDTAANDVLETYYMAYLESALKYAYIYMRDQAKVELSQMKLDSYLSNANRNNSFRTAGSLQVTAA